MTSKQDLEKLYRAAGNVNELGLTSAALKAGARHLAEACALENSEYLKCKVANNGDPAACMKQGMTVTKCTLNFFRALKTNCEGEFTAQFECLDENNQTFGLCRQTQAALDQCVFDKMKLKGGFRTYDTPASKSSYATQ
eukprot:m.267119 g.267119  ORF g.267119 m.267119 type:complete len:139 (+) comp32235_c0_seq1:51-467(+)